MLALQSTANQFSFLNVKLELEDIMKANVSSTQGSALDVKSTTEKLPLEESVFRELLFTSTELDPDEARLMQFYVANEYPIYLLDYTTPEMNTSAFALRFGDIKVDQAVTKNRLQLAAMMVGLSAAALGSVIALPAPLNWIAVLALGGPLFVSAYGFITQNN